MPNWCQNVIYVSHEDEKKMVALKDAILNHELCDHIMPMPEELKGHILAPFLLFLFDFPKPYMRIRKTETFSKLNIFDQIILESAKMGLVKGFEVPNWPLSYVQTLFSEAEPVTLSIDWGKNDATLTKEFAGWLKQNRKKPENKKRIRQGQALKSLAASRLKNTFLSRGAKVAQIPQELQAILGDDLDTDAAKEFVPFFSEQSQINRAAEAARAYVIKNIARYWRYTPGLLGPRTAVPWLPNH